MLVLSRKLGERICIGRDVTIQVVSIERDRVRLGVVAPRDLPVHREEVAKAIAAEEAKNHDPA